MLFDKPVVRRSEAGTLPVPHGAARLRSEHGRSGSFGAGVMPNSWEPRRFGPVWPGSRRGRAPGHTKASGCERKLDARVRSAHGLGFVRRRGIAPGVVTP